MGTSEIDFNVSPFTDRKEFYKKQIIRGLRKCQSYPNIPGSTVYISDKYLPGYSARRKQHEWKNWSRNWCDHSYYYKPLYSAAWPYEGAGDIRVSDSYSHAKRWPATTLPNPKFVK